MARCCCHMTTVLLSTCTGFSMSPMNLSLPHATVGHKDKTVLPLFKDSLLIYTCACDLTLYLHAVLVKVSACVCPCSPPSAIPMTSQLLRGLPRTKVLASTLLPCKQHQSQPGAIPHQPASRWPYCLWQNCHSRSYNTSPVLHNYILTPPQVNSILKANEYSFKVCGFILFYYNNAFQIKTI